MISVESVATYSQKPSRQYLAIVTVKVEADSPAEAAMLAQSIMLGEPHLTVRVGPARPAFQEVRDGS